MAEFMILRPSLRTFRIQLIGALVVGALVASLLVIAEDGFGWLGRAAFGFGAAGLAAAVQSAWLSRGRRWLGVVTSEGLLVREVSGMRREIRWADIQKAQHTTGLLGMRWRLELPGTSVVIRDIGITPDRWAILWQAIVAETTGRARPVQVDTISNTLFDREPPISGPPT